MTILFLALLMSGETPKNQSTQLPGTVMMCKPAEPKGPSLFLADKDGKCSRKDTKPMSGPDGKTMYCFSTVHPKPVECKAVPVGENAAK